MAAQTFAGRVFRSGGSMAVAIKPAVIAALGIVPGDTLIMSIWGRHLIMRKVSRDDVIRLDTIPVGALPGGRNDDKS
jgi:antitoxin component of MazEF toxin-antitoxin module